MENRSILPTPDELKELNKKDGIGPNDFKIRPETYDPNFEAPEEDNPEKEDE